MFSKGSIRFSGWVFLLPLPHKNECMLSTDDKEDVFLHQAFKEDQELSRQTCQLAGWCRELENAICFVKADSLKFLVKLQISLL